MPRPSPNNRLVAHTRKNDLWLLDVATGKSTQITHVGKPYDERHASVFVYITDWSPDSQRILYNVSPGTAACVDCTDRTGWEVQSADYGFYIYDLETKTTQPVEFPGKYQVWLPDGDFLLGPPGSSGAVNQLLRFTPGDAAPVPLTRAGGHYGQLDVSRDGRWVLAGLGKFASTSQVVKIAMSSGEATPITSVGKWAEHQWPEFSPSGTRIAHIRQVGLAPSGQPKTVLVVEGRSLHTCMERLIYRWIDDRTLALECQQELVILDAETAKEKGRYPLARENAEKE